MLGRNVHFDKIVLIINRLSPENPLKKLFFADLHELEIDMESFKAAIRFAPMESPLKRSLITGKDIQRRNG